MILTDLNEQQIEAVTTINGPLQIIAGAGSGKTRVITCRIAYLIEQGIKPWNILALTFTNKAAKEMKNRIAELLDEQSANGVWAGTFHSIFARILKMEANEIGFDRYFTIYDTDDSLRALKNTIKEQFLDKEYKPSSILNAISKIKNDRVTPQEYIETLNRMSKFSVAVGNCYRGYQNYLKRNNAMDFDDLLLNTLLLFYNNSEVLSKYQNKFRYILIDEYQDTNKVQYEIIYKLAQAMQNICIVGDDAQSIYKWRGADISNILNFNKNYPYCKTIKLEQNYRSTKNILAAADSVIKQNKEQLAKKLWTDNPEGEKIKLLKFNDDREEAENTIRNIANKIGEQSLKNTAILYRTNAQSLAFEKACRIFKIPYIVVGGTSFYKRKEIKDVLAYLQILVNPNDNISLQRIINEPPRGIGGTSIEKIEGFAKTHSISFFDALNHLDKIDIRQKKTIANINLFINLINKHRELVRQNTPQEVFNISTINTYNNLEHLCNIELKQIIDQQQLIKRLSSNGFSKVEYVSRVGEYAVRGNIIDIFPPKMSDPIRVELWGDEVDSIKVFDIMSQETKKESKKISFTDSMIDLEKQQTKTPFFEELSDNPFVNYIANTGIISYYEEVGTLEAQDRIRNIKQLLLDIINYFLKYPNDTLQNYLEQISLTTDIDIKDLNADVLTLMTAHSAKGLEYDYVYIVGMENDLFPLPARDGDEDNTEEERRLFYVGITRARKELTLSYCDRRQKFGEYSSNKPSFFLKEIERDLLLDEMENTFLYDYQKETFSEIRQPFFPKKLPFQAKKEYPVFNDMQYEDNYSQIPKSNPFESVPYKPGDIVQHNQFGLGKVIASSGLGDGLKLTIHFGSVGKKQLIAKYAKLQKVKTTE